MTQAERAIHRQPAAGRSMPGFSRRMWVYLREMYPPGQRLFAACVLYVSFTAILANVHQVQLRFDLVCALLGIWDAFTLALITRLSDELKDLTIDRDLFPERPLPSGRVREADIRISLGLLCAFFMVPHFVSGLAVPTAAALLVYAFFMFHYFFVPREWKSKLLVNFATHNPIIAALLIHLVVLFSQQHGLLPVQIRWPQTLLLLAMYWSLLGSWELARKIRYREEETSYQTYSQIFGRTGSVAVALTVQTLGLVAGLYLGSQRAVTPVYSVLLVAAYVMLVRSYVLFLRRRLPGGKPLGQVAEWFAGLVMQAGLVGFTLIPGIQHVLS